MKIDAAYYSAVGKRRCNEDTVFFTQNDEYAAAVVADGLGGEGNGDIASQTAVKAITDYLSDGRDDEKKAADAIRNAEKAIKKLHVDGNKMKSTAAVLYITPKTAVAAHVGDTRIYQFRKNKVVFQSTDHSVSQMSVLAGAITNEQIRGHIDRNRLTNALGSRDDADVDVTKLNCKTGDAFLLCTDGFWEYVLEDEMCADLAASANADEWLAKMRGRVESRISPTGDNHSAITITVS